MKIIKPFTILRLEMLSELTRQTRLIQTQAELTRLQTLENMLEKQRNCMITSRSIPL
ncbi:hypothetical protein D3C87_1908940 [compost metagenome]